LSFLYLGLTALLFYLFPSSSPSWFCGFVTFSFLHRPPSQTTSGAIGPPSLLPLVCVTVFGTCLRPDSVCCCGFCLLPLPSPTAPKQSSPFFQSSPPTTPAVLHGNFSFSPVASVRPLVASPIPPLHFFVNYHCCLFRWGQVPPEVRRTSYLVIYSGPC